MSLKHFASLSALLVFTLVTPNLALADGIGTTVTGMVSLSGGSTNYFDATKGLVPAGYGNSAGSSSLMSNTAAGTAVTIGSGTEFGASDSIVTYSFDFTGDSLIFTNNASGQEEIDISFTFFNPSFTGFTLVGLQGANQTFDFTGNTLTLNVLLGNSTSSSTTYNYSTIAATPEPGSLVLLGTGILGVAGMMRRRVFNR